MRLDTGLFQQQTQKQILSPQMIQSMEILVLNQQQLEERINEELESNVALERSESESAEKDGESGSTAEIEIESDSEVFDLDQDRSEFDELIDLGERYEQLRELQQADFWAESTPTRKSSLGSGEDEFEWVDHVEGPSETLAEHLLAQLRLKTVLSQRQIALCEEIIFNLDERGWRLHSLEEIADGVAAAFESAQDRDPRWDDVIPSSAEWEDALHMIQSLDPAGVGAENLIDCLCLQLHRDPADNQLEELLVRWHLDDLAKNRLPQIAKVTGRTLEEIKLAAEVKIGRAHV